MDALEEVGLWRSGLRQTAGVIYSAHRVNKDKRELIGESDSFVQIYLLARRSQYGDGFVEITQRLA